MLSFFSRMLLRISGIILSVGALVAVGGWLFASLNPHPLASSWAPSILAVFVGTIIVVVGMWLLYIEHFMQAGLVGRIGAYVLTIGALVLIVVAGAIDLVFLPALAHMTAMPSLTAPIQTALNTTIGGINSSLSTVTSGLNTVGAGIGKASSFFGSSSGGFSISAPTVPSVSIPNVDGNFLVGTFLSIVGLPPLGNLGSWGLSFVSGAPLAFGCLLLGLAFLRINVPYRSALRILIVCAALNLLFLFFVHIAFFTTVTSLLIFPALAWFGITLWFPWKLHIQLPFHLHLPALPFHFAWMERMQKRLHAMTQPRPSAEHNGIHHHTTDVHEGTTHHDTASDETASSADDAHHIGSTVA
jgi:hypothetical protein